MAESSDVDLIGAKGVAWVKEEAAEEGGIRERGLRGLGEGEGGAGDWAGVFEFETGFHIAGECEGGASEDRWTGVFEFETGFDIAGECEGGACEDRWAGVFEFAGEGETARDDVSNGLWMVRVALM